MATSTRLAVGFLLLGAQLCGVAWARFVPYRYFCWAPFDVQTEYSTEVTVGGRALDEKEIETRYHQPAKGRDNRAVANVWLTIEDYERTYGKNDSAAVTLRYTVNGSRQGTWSWPP